MAEFELPFDAEGVVVTDAQSLSARAGLQRGDILMAINGVSIATTADVAAAAQEPTRIWAVDLIREGRAIRLRFRF